MSRKVQRLRACLLAMAIATPAVAQTPAPQPAPPVRPAQPKTTPAPSGMSEQSRSALKLAGLVTFVANACPDLKPNYAHFEQAIAALGVTTGTLEAPDMKGAYIGYTTRYNADPKANCERAKVQFGPAGTTLPGIFEPR